MKPQDELVWRRRMLELLVALPPPPPPRTLVDLGLPTEHWEDCPPPGWPSWPTSKDGT